MYHCLCVTRLVRCERVHRQAVLIKRQMGEGETDPNQPIVLARTGRNSEDPVACSFLSPERYVPQWTQSEIDYDLDQSRGMQ